jgi:hypothetical protein
MFVREGGGGVREVAPETVFKEKHGELDSKTELTITSPYVD